MKSEAEWIKPSEIEKRSFEIIGGELERMGIAIPQETAPVVMRCIHTSADFDYAKNLVFTEDVIPKAVETLRRGAVIITDTHMAQAGINKKSLEKLGGRTLCFMSDEDVAYEAKAKVFELDGVSVDAWDSEGWWANVRMSNTEPLVRLNLEGRTREIMEVKRDEFLAQIRA